MFSRSFFTGLWVLVLSSGVCFAQEASVVSCSLEALVEQALKKSDRLAASQSRVEGQKSAAKQARAWENPVIDFSVGQKREASAEGPVYHLSASQPVAFPGKLRLRGEVQDLETQSLEARLKEARLAFTRELVRLAYQYETARKKKLFAVQRQKRFELIQSYLEGYPAPSPQQQAERRIVEARLADLAVESGQIDANLKEAHEKIAVYCDWPEGTLPVIELPWLTGNGSVDVRAGEAVLKAKNPSLQAEKLSVAATDTEMRLAKREAWPDFSLTAFFEQEEAEETERQAGGGVSVPLPLFNRNARGIEGARHKLAAENRELRFEEKRILAEYRTLHAQYQAAQLHVRRYSGDFLKKFEEGAARAEEDFTKGLIPLLTFLELDEETTKTVFQTLEAQAELAQKYLELLSMTGEEEMISKLAAQ